MSLFLNIIFIVVGLAGGIWAKATYEQWYQQPLCFEYAQAKAVPDLDYLHFDGVGLATGRQRSHHCAFIDTRTGTPVVVRFDKADVPTGLDTLQLCVMIMPMIFSGLVASVFWLRYYK